MGCLFTSHGNLQCNYYRPQRSCGQGYVFTRVCDSVNRGVCLSECWNTSPPDSRHPPGADTPLGADPPRSRPPGSRHPPRKQTPHPRSRHPPGSRLRHMVNERPVHIILKCILVYSNYPICHMSVADLHSKILDTCSFHEKLVEWWYRSGTLNSNTVNSKFHLIRSFFEIFARFLSFHV